MQLQQCSQVNVVTAGLLGNSSVGIVRRSSTTTKKSWSVCVSSGSTALKIHFFCAKNINKIRQNSSIFLYPRTINTANYDYYYYSFSFVLMLPFCFISLTFCFHAGSKLKTHIQKKIIDLSPPPVGGLN